VTASAVGADVSYGIPLKRVQRVGPAEVAYLEAGPRAAPVVVLLHGFPTHSFLWRHVVHQLDERVRLLAPDLMGLGDTTVSPYEDFTAPMQAELLLEWLDGVGVAQAVLVGHEQGGAVAQQIVANHAERARGLVLVDSVAYGNWPIPLAAHVMRLARTPGLDVLAYALEVPRRAAHNARIGFGRAVWDKRVMTEAVVDEYLRPFATTEGRERARRFLLAGDNRYTLECVTGLRAYDGPSAVVWGADDWYLSPSWGQQLVEDLQHTEHLRLIPFCGHLVPEERPDAVADAILSVVEAAAA
jgi:pimeloyl-ACP methyl ester carboxylesterase